MKGVPWTEAEIDELRIRALRGEPWDKIALVTGHTAAACQQMASKNGWALVTKGPKPGEPMEAACLEQRIRNSSARFVAAFGRVA